MLLEQIARHQEPGIGWTSNTKHTIECQCEVVSSLYTRTYQEEELQGQPFAGTHTVEDHVGRNLEEYNAKRQHLLTDIELVLIDSNIFHEVVGDSICHVTTIEFYLALFHDTMRTCLHDNSRRQKKPRVSSGMMIRSSLDFKVSQGCKTW